MAIEGGLMPLAHFRCSICKASCPKAYLAHGQLQKRMAWLRKHRKAKHPSAWRKSIAKRKRSA